MDLRKSALINLLRIKNIILNCTEFLLPLIYRLLMKELKYNFEERRERDEQGYLARSEKSE